MKVTGIGPVNLLGELEIPLKLPKGWRLVYKYQGGLAADLAGNKLIISVKKPLTSEEKLLIKMEGRTKFVQRKIKGK